MPRRKLLAYSALVLVLTLGTFVTVERLRQSRNESRIGETKDILPGGWWPLLGGQQRGRLSTKGEVRRILGPPDTVEVQEGPIRPLPIGPPLALVKAECWSYAPEGEITEAKLCFGQTGTLVRVEQ